MEVRVWAPSDNKIWIQALVISSENDDYIVRTNDGKQMRVRRDTCVLINAENSVNLDDMIEMSELHEAIILHNLQQRYEQDKIYTYIGPMIVSINPFKDLDIYDHETLLLYHNKPLEQLPPHLYAIAHKAYMALVEQGESQSMIISGESGAGKTEATKYILRFLSHVASASTNDQDGLSKRILATNPILEAFGNSKTQRNHNSSRFGKFIKILMSKEGKYLGASINNYLLEKTRVVYQAPTERNYHVFYQLLTGACQEEIETYKLLSVSEYNYLTNGSDPKLSSTTTINMDKSNFAILKKSFEELGIENWEVSNFLSLLSAILHIGNIEFIGEDQVTLSSTDTIKIISQLLLIPQDILCDTLIHRSISAAGEKCKIPLRYAQAIENRDALAKALYSRMFDYLIKRCNDCIGGDTKLSQNLFIGVLDIYGFENFLENSLEQFCINFANEKLHHQFIENMFKAEQEQYLKEGVQWENIDFVDNFGCLQLIEKYGGILSMMDEEGKMPKGCDKTLIEKLWRKHRACPYFVYDEFNPDSFNIKHFAATVPYIINGFMEKNKDTLQDDVIAAMYHSTCPLIRNLFPAEVDLLSRTSPPPVVPRNSVYKGNESISISVTPANSPVGPIPNRELVQIQRRISTTGNLLVRPTLANNRGRISSHSLQNSSGGESPREKGVTVCRKFQNDLITLIEILSSSNRHYIRCLKPNDELRSEVFDQPKLLGQLRSNGILETVRLRKAGFNRRLSYQAFVDRYHLLGCTQPDQQSVSEFLQKREDPDPPMSGLNLFSPMRLSSSSDWSPGKPKQWAAGLTQLFMRDGLANRLEAERTRAYDIHVTTIQSHVRVYFAKEILGRFFLIWEKKLRSVTVIQARVRGFWLGVRGNVWR